MGNFANIGGFSFSVGTGVFQSGCDIGLGIGFAGCSGKVCTRIQEAFVDGQLEYKNLMNIKKVHADAEAKRLQELKDKAKQKSVF
jgi:hypothetical protein